MLPGFGASLCFVPCLVIVTLWFDKRRTFATGLASSGAGFGPFLFPLVIELFLFYYGFQGTMLLLGAIGLHCIASGIVMVDNKSHNKNTVPHGLNNVCLTEGSSSIHEHIGTNIDESVNAARVCVTPSEDQLLSMTVDITEKKIDVSYIEQNDFESGKNTNKNDSLLMGENIDNSLKEVASEIRNTLLKQGGISSQILSASKVLKLVSASCGCSVWMDKSFIAFAFCQGFLSLSQTTSHMLMSALAVDMGYTIYEAASFLVITGISDTISRMFVGLLLDWKYLRSHRYYCWLLMLALFCISTLIKPFADHYVIMAIACVTSGLGSGSIISQRPVIAYELLGREKLDSSVAFIIFLQGGLVLVGPVIAGWNMFIIILIIINLCLFINK